MLAVGILLGSLAGGPLFALAESPRPLIQSSKPEVPNTLSSRIDPKAQLLLDKAIQALGGPAFLSFKTLTTHGRAFSIADEATVGFVYFDSEMQFPDKRRFSYGFGKKRPVVLLNNGDQAWELDRMGLTKQPADQARTWKIANHYSLENLLRLRIHEPGVLVQPGGVDFVDNVPTTVVEIFDPSQVHAQLYLSKQTFLPVQVKYRAQNEKTLEWDEYADVYGDYRSVRGIQTPMHISRFLNGERVAETFRSSAEYDQTYPPNDFQIAAQ